MKSYKPLKLAWLLALGSALLPGLILWAAPIPTGPIYTKQRSFRIPFHYNSDELSRLGAREIRLYVSRDRGRTWQLDQTVFSDHGRFNPETNKFKFQAATDGEYWFLVRTLDSRNHLFPDMNTTDPGLQVVVDSKPPVLKLELFQPAAGTVQLSWNATDDHLDTTELRLEYLQPGGASEWQPVSVIPKASGQTGWKVPQGGVVAVRGSIADLAGNTDRQEVELRILPASQVVPRPGGPETRQPVAGPASNPGSGQGSDPRDRVAMSMPDRFPSSSGTGQEDVADGAPAAVKETPQIVRWPSTDMISAGAAPKSSFVSHKPDSRLGAAAEPQSFPQMSERPIREQAVPEQPIPEHLRRSSTAGRKRVVDSKRFQIGYNLEGVGPSGVSSVDLYITDDNGATWYHYGADEDRQSPFQVEVPREGTYGFALGVRSGAGLTSEAPQNGDLPSIVVVVDQTTPRLEMLPVEQGLGKNVNKLLISWKCEDENLAERPISLFYSASGQAPWLPVSGPMENSGRFVWTIGAGVPVKFYLRIEARDLAGHVQIIDSPQPIVVDLSRPTAKIIDVESPTASGLPR